MIIESVLAAAEPLLAGRQVTDAVLGLSLTAVELDGLDIGVSYVLRHNLPAGCSIFGFAQDIIGKPAFEVASLAVKGRDDAQRGVGMAVITAATRSLDLPDEPNTPTPFGLKVLPGDTVGMIGYIPPVANQLGKLANRVLVFDRGLSSNGGEGAAQATPMELQSQLLPECDLMIITGTTLINNTLEQLLGWCTKAREIVLVGASTPMIKEAFKGTGVTALAGSWWDAAYKQEMFKRLSLSCGIHHLREMMIKKLVQVEA
ncbi:MAG TPA: DUF364 domain-containing protein [Chloroflexi bacterium]|jgi:uncharacterized protein (DUF4213/DUF364 family)|nr:DUF364 domain-containing protein [Chloroflexota bacterium]